MPSLEEQLNALTPMEAPKGYKGPSQEELKTMVFRGKEQEAGRDMETAVERMGESETKARRRELAEQVALERKVEYITQHVGESLMKKVIEFSADPSFAGQPAAKQFTAAMETMLPTVFAELKAAYPDSDDSLLTGQILQAYSRVLGEMGIAGHEAPQAGDLKTTEMVMRSKKAGVSSEGVVPGAGTPEEIEDVNRTLAALKPLPSTADFSRAAGMGPEPKAAPAMFRLSDLRKKEEPPKPPEEAAA